MESSQHTNATYSVFTHTSFSFGLSLCILLIFFALKFSAKSVNLFCAGNRSPVGDLVTNLRRTNAFKVAVSLHGCE